MTEINEKKNEKRGRHSDGLNKVKECNISNYVNFMKNLTT